MIDFLHSIQEPNFYTKEEMKDKFVKAEKRNIAKEEIDDPSSPINL